MSFPFVMPGPLQAFRKNMFYWRAVLTYRAMLDAHAHTSNKVEFKFLQVILLCLAVKTIEKGNREETERHLHDYGLRKANIDAAEKAMWEEELALHAVDTAVAEAAVLRQRQVDWKYRSDPRGHAYAMLSAQYPFIATISKDAELK
jgi:hypothetical protein